MVRDALFEILRCPENGSQLTAASDAVISQLNLAIRARRIRNKAGQVVENAIDGGLVRSDGTLLYPIVDKIPVLLQDEAIPLQTID